MTPEELLILIAKGETSSVIKSLLASTRVSNPRMHEEVVHLSAQYQSFRRESRAGVLSREEKDTRLSQIHSALIELVQELPKGTTLAGAKEVSVAPLNLRRWWWPVLALVVVLIAVAGYWGFQKSQAGTEPADEPAVVTHETNTSPPSITADDPNEDVIQVDHFDQPPASKPTAVVSPPPPSITYDTIELRLNQGVTVLIDDKRPDFVFETMSIKRIRVPSSARKISLVIDGKKYTRPLHSLPDPPIYQRSFIQ